MKPLFKSPTRARAENMLDDITRQRAEIVIKRQGIAHKFEESSKLFFEDQKLDIEARILRKLLRK